MDKREAILQRLVEIAAGLDGVATAVRNQDEISERVRPAIAIFDADESAAERAREHPGRAPNVVEMAPELLILLGAKPERVGSDLNRVRAKLINAVLTDQALIEATGPNGHVRYAGCGTHLGHGRSMEGSMSVQFSFSYVLRPEQL